MAKKTKGVELQFDLSGSCKIHVNPNFKASFERDLKRGELSLSTSLQVGDDVFNFDIYANDVEGTFKFEPIDKKSYKLVLKGTYETIDDTGDLAPLKKLSSPPELLLDYVGDHDVNSHYIDGDEDKKLKIGKLRA